MARILLVDDDRDIREMGRALLSASGHDVFTADSVVTALQFIAQNPLDVLITDATMPTHSGFDLVRTLKKDPRHSNLTMAMLTGRRERKDIEKAMELGIHDYIVKPLDPHLFLKKVNDLLERRPPPSREELEAASLRLSASATLLVTAEVRLLSEHGMTLHIPTQQPEGMQFRIESELFHKIGLLAPLLRVLSSQEREGGWETRVSFVGLDEDASLKIRTWLEANAPHKTRMAG